MTYAISSSYLRRSFQILSTLQPNENENVSEFERASDIVYRWAKSKFRKNFSDLPYNKQTLDLKNNMVELGVIYDSSQEQFVLRCAHPDSSIPGRFWTTDVHIFNSGKAYILAVRLSTASLQSDTSEIPYSCPGFIKQIIRDVGMTDIIPIQTGPHTLTTKTDIDNFAALLENPNRKMPIVLITPCTGPSTSVENEYMMDPKQMAIDLTGVAHVFSITTSMGYSLTEKLGKNWSAYNGAVRTYYPGLSLEESNYYRHPLLTKEKIKLRDTIDTDDADFCMHEIESYVRAYVSKAQIPWENYHISFYLALRQQMLSQERTNSSHTTFQQLKDSYEDQIAQLKKEKEEYAAYGEGYCKDNDDLKEENAQQRQLNMQLKNKIRFLENRLQMTTDMANDVKIPTNPTYQELHDWIINNFPDRLYLHPRAERSLKKAIYDDIPLVYKCVKLLGTSYYEYRIGKIDRAEFEANCNQVDPSLSECAAITDVAAGMQGSTYYVPYHNQQKKLERHLTKGSNRDSRYCLRIYFFWDDQDQVVVIGDLPHHLDTTAT